MSESRSNALEVRDSCPECGAPFATGLWDHSHLCDYCGSLLLLPRDAEHDVYVVGDDCAEPERCLEIVISQEVSAFRTRVLARAEGPEAHGLEAAGLERRAEQLRSELEQSLELVEQSDFYAPYRVAEQVIAQAILGRRQRHRRRASGSR